MRRCYCINLWNIFKILVRPWVSSELSKQLMDALKNIATKKKSIDRNNPFSQFDYFWYDKKTRLLFQC